MWCHQLQFLCRWHHVPGEELIPGQRHIPSLPTDGELRPAQGQAQPGWQLHQHGGHRGRREGRGAGQYHGCSHSFLCLTELHAATVTFPSTQLGAREERHQRSRNKSEEVSGELLWFTLHPLMHIYLSFRLSVIKQETEDVTSDYFFLTQRDEDNLLMYVCIFVCLFFKLTFRIEVPNTYNMLELSRANGITLLQVFHLNCHHPFLYEELC